MAKRPIKFLWAFYQIRKNIDHWNCIVKIILIKQKVVFNEVSFYNMKPLYPDIKNVILTKKIITGQQLKN